MTITVVVADDQEVVRSGLVTILNAQPDIDVIAEAADGVSAVELALRLRPTVCLFDIRMPGLDGIDATRRVAGPDVADPLAVVVITTFDLDEYVFRALAAGAVGFLLKDVGRHLLVEAIRAAANGDALIAPAVTRRLLSAFADSKAALAPTGRAISLTSREEDVIRRVAAGRTNPEIAADLHLGLSTIKTHLGNISTKLSARNRVEIAMWAYQNGKTDPEDTL